MCDIITIFAPMKYTKYFINGDYIDTDALNAMPKIMFPFTLAAALMGFFIGMAAIPVAVVGDGFRSAKYASIMFEHKHHFKRTVVQSKPVTILLNNPVTREVRNLLKRVA